MKKVNILFAGLLFLFVSVPHADAALPACVPPPAFTTATLVSQQQYLSCLKAQLETTSKTAPVAKSPLKIVPTDGWQYVRPPVDKDFGEVVQSRQPYKNEDILKVYLVRNHRLYEDAKWQYEKYTGKVSNIQYKWTKNTQTDEYKIWNIFADIAGDEFIKTYVARYVTIRDDQTSTLGQVWRAGKKEPSWVLGMNANAADFTNDKWTREMVVTLIHEYAHLLTLNKTQVKDTFSSKACKGRDMSRLGCPYEKSYFTAFADEFIDNKDAKHYNTVYGEADASKAWKLTKAYYKKNPDDFVTQYAAKNIEEDMAESFTDFVLQNKPPSNLTEKEQKILFFYDYPELVKKREEIRSVVQQYFK